MIWSCTSKIVEAVYEQMKKGTNMVATEVEVEYAEYMIERIHHLVN